MKFFIGFVADQYCESQHLEFCDVGSMDVNGTYKPIVVENPNWSYVGIDISSGKNVDVVVTETNWDILENKFDCVISGNTMEHVKDIYQHVLDMKRICKPDGYIIVVTPLNIKQHRYPVDCWRILPDGMRFLFEKIAKMKVITTDIKQNDCYAVAQKIT